MASIVFLAAGSVFFRGVDLSTFFNRNAMTMEHLSDGINQLSTVLPQVVRIRSCSCSGAGGNEAGCAWNPATEWHDPVINFGVSTPGTPVTIFDADYEWGIGGNSSFINATQDLAADQTLTSFYTGAGLSCNTTLTGGHTSRGCRQRVQLIYTAASVPGGSLPHLPGVLTIRLINGAGATRTDLNIGNVAGMTSSRAGLVRMSCGFVQPEAGRLGTDFVINLRSKVKTSNVENPSASNYESWVEGQANYDRGFFREAKLRFSFLNLTQRGAYQWRMLSNRNCISSSPAVAPAAAPTNREQCCSFALDTGTNTCLSQCVSSGVAAASAAACCSEKWNGGFCL